MWLAILFISFGIFSRLIPHLPNFAPLAAVALFSGVYYNKKHGYLLPLAIYIVSDLILGLHSAIFFTWSSIILIYFLGSSLKKRKTPVSTLSYTLAASFLFFFITNFGVWLVGYYPRNLEGLTTCFMRAIPFFRTSLTSNLFFVVVSFSLYEYFLSHNKVVQETA